ncbi:sensor histidine kinase [Marinactinospora thermotolerans]|uniref:sensor histidine kinase n=1 Tax=Marinactinospora thermotolerans TaxID=531310 RepID=UPI003D94BFE0
MPGEPRARAATGPRWGPSAPATVAVAGAAAVLAAAWAIDLVHAVDRSALPHVGGWWAYPPVVSGAVMALLTLRALPPGASPRRTGLLGICALLTTSLVSLAYRLAPGDAPGHPDGLAEVLAMVGAVSLIAYRCRPWVVAVAAALTLVAPLLSETLRAGRPADLDAALVLLFLLAPGLYLRWRVERRRWQVERVRQEERDTLARDLHDVVAHHVTGIVVQAQALRYVDDPHLARAALPDIERAGLDALEAMQRLVTALRGGHPVSADLPDAAEGLRSLRRPGGGSRARVEVRITGDPGLLPREVASAVVRMAQEALTNADRHAHGAGLITVVLDVTADRARLEVRDDGRGGPVGPGSGGYGLVGMAERAALLGGSLDAGPAPEGTGWRVVAVLPTGRAPVAGRSGG